MHRKIPVCSYSSSWLVAAATATLPGEQDLSPANGAWSKALAPGNRWRESRWCLKTSTCVSLLSRKSGPNAAEKSAVTGLYPSPRDRRTQLGILQPPPAHSPPLAPCQKVKSPTPDLSTKKSLQKTTSPSLPG